MSYCRLSNYATFCAGKNRWVLRYYNGSNRLRSPSRNRVFGETLWSSPVRMNPSLSPTYALPRNDHFGSASRGEVVVTKNH